MEQPSDKPQVYDLIIVGIGPAGLMASIYASRYRLSNLLVGLQLGGELAYAHKIENFPGFNSISGNELAQKLAGQVATLGGKIIYEEVGRLGIIDGSQAKQQERFFIETTGKKVFLSKSLIVATGSERRRLDVPGEKELVGRGVSYCTTCDAPFYRDKVVGVVGGSDAAVTGAIHAAEFARKVFIIYRGEQLRAEPIWLDEVKKLIDIGKVEVIYKTNVVEILTQTQALSAGREDNRVKLSGDVLGGVKLDKPYNNSGIVGLDGLFIEIGGVPGSSLVKPLGVVLTESGHVEVDETMATNITGLFCAGDMVDRSQVMQQAITAMAQGAIAASRAYKFLKGSQAPRILGV